MNQRIQNLNEFMGILFLKSEKENNCLVCNEREFIAKSLADNSLLLVENTTPTYSYYSRTSGARRIILFGKKDREYPMLKSQDSNDANKFFTHEWFDHQEGSVELAFFIVPNGSKLFTDPGWDEKFPKWVSFGENLQFLSSSVSLRQFNNKEYKEIYARLFKAFLEATSPKNAVKSMKTVFESTKKAILNDVKGRLSEDEVLAMILLDMNEMNLDNSD